MRILIALAGTILLGSLAPHIALAEDELAGAEIEARLPAHEPNTYRFGILLEAAPATTPGECELVCNQNSACRVWSLVPVAAGQAARCELKRSVGAAQYRPGATSGIAAHLQPPAPVALPSTDTVPGQASAPAIKPAHQPAQALRTPSSSSASASSPQPLIFYPTKPNLLGGGRSSAGQSRRSLTPPLAPVPPAASRPTVIPQK